MICHFWSASVARYLLFPLCLVYGCTSHMLRLSYLLGLRKVWRAPIPIVIVGNLTIGGNGKTPLVIWLVEALQNRGLRVGVASRGYGGKAKHYPLIVRHNTTTHQVGDEPILVYQRTRAIVGVAPIRQQAVEAILDYSTVDIIITDDGLQHYALARDIEIVVIDGTRRFGNGWWLPMGPMRELESRLLSVTAIITNGGVALPGELSMHLLPGLAVNLFSGEKKPVEKLENVIAMAGIGYPKRFFNTLYTEGVRPLKTISFVDHQSYNLQALTKLTTSGQILLMTEKDAVKVRSFAKKNWWYLPVKAVLPSHEAQVLLNTICGLLPFSTTIK
ncbi:Tetraacyldisaccharide 4'-kinase [Candidatus Erwinia haradaeae]|uniref:Tetraacyldisaccharide 4'-kinase n=1 Tax=Candidatus Erwinia haradaeae TaxID=1922217 RepID=A0A451DDE6_9GAMM|nr:tetraacyldisaccharide 4'-kinase [Candidatus Erwinia haradaeae]VFP84509.1 Tetraacyldisaccharide 4'-kinase [Candidatus Erwinia haradaeae]